MSFGALIKKTGTTAFNRFANCNVLVTFGGAVMNTVRGIFDESVEVVSPNEMSQVQFKPVLTLQDSDLIDVTSEHTLTITRDDQSLVARDYRFDGKPRPDGNGLTIIYLAGKR